MGEATSQAADSAARHETAKRTGQAQHGTAEHCRTWAAQQHSHASTQDGKNRDRERERKRESDTGKTAMMQGVESERTRGKKCAEQIVAD